MRFKDWFYKEEIQDPNGMGQVVGPNKIQVDKATQTLANKFSSNPKNAVALNKDLTNALTPKAATTAAMKFGAQATSSAPPNLKTLVNPVNVAADLFKSLTGNAMPKPPNLQATV